MKFKGRKVCGGKTEGEALVSEKPLSFYGGIDPKTGKIIEKNNKLYGLTVKDKILVFPYGKGSTVGSYVLYEMSKNKTAPKAIINLKTETIIAAGCILGNIPLIDNLKEDEFYKIKTGDYLIIDADNGIIEIK